MITKHEMLIFLQILSTSIIRNISGTLRRTCILGLKGLSLIPIHNYHPDDSFTLSS